MLDARVKELRDDFAAAISSTESDVTLDASITTLRNKLSRSDILESFSIYSKGHLRRIDDSLRDISTARLKTDPLQVAMAVESIFELFAWLGATVEQSTASDQRIEANRSY